MKRSAIVFVLFLVLVFIAARAFSQVPCGPVMPKPKLGFLSKNVDGGFMRYWFTVTNRAQYPNILFAASPNLPPCGLNNNASRTWLDIFNGGNGQRIYGYCALSSNTQMGRLSFAVPLTAPQPKSFFITLTDRKCNAKVKSNVAAIP